MANQCGYCEVRHIPTNILILGQDWIEYCVCCGNKYYLTNQITGEKLTVAQVAETLKKVGG